MHRLIKDISKLSYGSQLNSLLPKIGGPYEFWRGFYSSSIKPRSMIRLFK